MSSFTRSRRESRDAGGRAFDRLRWAFCGKGATGPELSMVMEQTIPLSENEHNAQNMFKKWFVDEIEENRGRQSGVRHRSQKKRLSRSSFC
jgi:hypothetical protein